MEGSRSKMSMKSLSIKLREGRKVGGGAASFCCILWDHKAKHFVTSSSSDSLIYIHNVVSSSTKALRNLHGVTAMALSHDSSLLASGSIPHCVKLFKFPSGELRANITRFTLPIRVLAFSVSDSLLAAAGDDKEINSIVSVLKRHSGPVTGLDFAPQGELLASLDSTGSVLCWNIRERTVHCSFEVAPDTVNMLRWSPNGQTLSVPGLRNDVVMYNGSTGEKLFTLSGVHVEPICCLTWSPNGKYIATFGLDKKLLLWDLHKRQDIHRLKLENKISCMAWKPNSNALSVIDVRGKYRIFESVVPSSMPSPILILSKKPVIDTEKLALRSKVSKSIAAPTEYKLQSPFQPGATPLEPGKRTFLCYNMLGWITRVEHERRYFIEACYHDTGRGPRGMAMTDFYGFTMASINENGCVFANSCKGEKNMSVLCYRPSSSWASNSEWYVSFEREEVKVVANGSGWVAAVTSLNMVHIFSEGGLQKGIIFIDGPVVTAAGCKDQLVLVTHVSDWLPSEEQVMEFRVFNIPEKTQLLKGRVSLSPRSHLTWIGFSEEGCLSSYDSEGVLRVFTSIYGGVWIQVFRKEKNDEANYWIVGLNSTEMYYIACKHPEVFPQVTPTPVLTSLALLPLPTS